LPSVELREIHKRFGPTLALDGASLELAPAEVHALLGENGAGKTTLVRVLYGLVRPDAGEIRIDGRRVEIRGPREAQALGIGLVHQHAALVPALSVAENLVLGEPGAFALPRAARRARAAEILREAGLELDLDVAAGALPVSQQQRLEIARTLARGARVLVLDEPTAVLAPAEVESLLALLARLRAEGRTIVFISHKLEEVTALCDRVSVLRRGVRVGTRAVAGASASELGRWMVGDALPAAGSPPDSAPGAPALRLRELRSPGLRGIDLEVRSGEIVALAGVEGNGQAPLEEILAGVRAPTSGEVRVLRGPLALIPADRQRTGLVLDLSCAENLVLPDAAIGGAPPVFRSGWLSVARLREVASDAFARFAVRGQPDAPARALSGGNQQKLCVARALRGDPGVLVAVNPTRGLDVAATAAVRDELRAHARRGGAVLLVSADLDEVLELGHRVLVLFRGALLPVEPERRTRERIGERMLGAGAA
jgi:simple sugar transport system ATP-binding protein